MLFDDYLVLVDYSNQVISFLEQKAPHLRVGCDACRRGMEMQREIRTPEVRALGKRLAEYVSKGQIVIRPDTYWNQYTYYWEMPAELQTRLAREATLIILKGDLNYRRLLSDRLWSPSTPVEEVVPYFPAAFVAFRILKSIPVMGIPATIVDKLEKEDPKWRLNGEHGIIQSVLK
ncbi:hypothetical protein JG688_00013557 [Phytophthora aleatoria]|uniref:Sugar phosphate phosphatase n=1 Tax=Phytophthora aleatoria TaxID=2496075 RepID=A0A8J5IM06_9STRA|nr:hypothetical protein JG688_00013557 [Phytophthora aleatoria]